MATSQTLVGGDLRVNGGLSALTFTCPAGAISDAAVSASASISASKLQHQHEPVYAQPNTTATTARVTIHVVYGLTGTITQFRAGSVVACVGAATISIQLKKNGSNILSSALVLDSANTAFILENAAGFTSTSLAAGDVLEVDVTATAGGGTLGTGLFCQLVVREDAA